MGELTRLITSGANDYYHDSLDFRSTSTYIIVGKYATLFCHGGLLFENVTIPQKARIVEAKIKIYGGLNIGSPTVRIYANEVDDAVAPTSIVEYNLLDRTTTYVSWMIYGSSSRWLYTDSLKGLVQIIVNRSGWTSGNSMQFIFDYPGSSWAYAFLYSFESGIYPQLEVTYGWGKNFTKVYPSKICGKNIEDVIKVVGIE
jgi:hypothetical protein